jgi:predicted metal-dependent peptidase
MASKLDKAKAQIVLDYPFFAAILLRRKLIVTREIPTLAVDARSNIYVNPDFIETLTVPQIVWGLCHEVGHVIAQHALRVGSRNRKKWNYAGDAWINDTLDDSNVGQRIPNCVDMQGSKDQTTEQIYDSLPDGDGPGGTGEDIFYGDGIDGQGKPLTSDEIREIEGRMKVEIAEAAQAAKMRGKLSGKLANIVADLLEVKTPWYEILEKHMTSLVQQGQSWRRRNRRFEDYLPSTDKLPQMGTLVVQVDVSGSVSKQELDHYAGHLSRIVEQCRPEKVHVLYTDTQVQKHVEFECGEEVNIEFFSGGGTHMPAGFDYCDEHGITPDVFVCLTDGYTDFGQAQHYPVVWCISSDIEAPHGENIHFEMA